MCIRKQSMETYLESSTFPFYFMHYFGNVAQNTLSKEGNTIFHVFTHNKEYSYKASQK